MNQGQFEAITSRLDRLIELLEAEQAISGEILELQADYEKVQTAPVEPELKPATKLRPEGSRRSKAA